MFILMLVKNRKKFNSQFYYMPFSKKMYVCNIQKVCTYIKYTYVCVHLYKCKHILLTKLYIINIVT